MAKRVAIRVDSSQLMGSGHLMRTLTLAERLRRDGTDVRFICRDLVGNLAYLVREKGFALELLPRCAENPSLAGYAAWLTVSQETDATETIAVLERADRTVLDRLIIDHYAIDEVWEMRLRPYAKEIFVIDDLANRRHDCDVLLDQNFYRHMQHRYDGLVPSTCRLLLGPQYALLREEFYRARETMRVRDGSLRRILVFYGGSDLTNETEKALTALLHLHLPDVEVDVVVGGGNENRVRIREICGGHPAFHYYEQVQNMAELMAHADLALGAGGTTTWERCFLGLPSIVTAIAENQYEICEDCHDAGLIQYIGKAEDVTVDTLQAEILSMTDHDKLCQCIERCLLEAGIRNIHESV